VLIPRPETELLIDFSVAAVEANPALGQGQWADLGTGSGALGIGLAQTIPTLSKVWAVDLAPEPAAHAAFNAARAGLNNKEKYEVVRGSWYDPLLARGCLGRLAGIVSNPPYITEDLMQGLQAEVGQYEPELALDGGEGLGIDALAPICRGAVEMLQPGGFLALETAGGEQAEYVAQLLQHLRCGVVANGAVVLSSSGGSSGGEEGESGEEHLAFENVKIRNDLRGVDRFVTATRSKYPCTHL
jgi:release factor glutamine methyltransferase